MTLFDSPIFSTKNDSEMAELMSNVFGVDKNKAEKIMKENAEVMSSDDDESINILGE